MHPTVMCRSIAGSHLFGAATADSDHDSREVFVPTKDQILLGRASYTVSQSTGDQHSKNGAGDVDVTRTTLQKFIMDLTQMDTLAIETLFSPNEQQSAGRALYWFNYIYQNRFDFLWDNRKKFIGYGKSQAMRYAVRGDRADVLQKLVALLETKPRKSLLKDALAPESIQLTGANLVYEWKDVNRPEIGKLGYIDVKGRRCAVTNTVGCALEMYQKPLTRAGHRTIAATETGNVDWKGMYHANRVIDEGIELFSTGELRFPCTHAEYYRKVRNGDFPIEAVMDRFEQRLTQLEEMDADPRFRPSPNIEEAEAVIAIIHQEVMNGRFLI